jgi:type-F conjugative transfer system pilin assembly thiol-disulfide isomerase TrbB
MASTGARTSGSLPTSPEDPEVKPLPAKPPVWYRLSNGRQINLADWKVVLFMQGHCPYCHQFDPVLKSLSARVGFGVMAYTIDGQGDASFPDALPAPPEVMKTFFPNLPVATPTTFLVNVNTLEALPLLQGATDEQGFMARMDTVLQMRGVGNNDDAEPVQTTTQSFWAACFIRAVHDIPLVRDVNSDMNTFFNEAGLCSNQPATGLAGAGRWLRHGRLTLRAHAGENRPAYLHDAARHQRRLRRHRCLSGLLQLY